MSVQRIPVYAVQTVQYCSIVKVGLAVKPASELSSGLLILISVQYSLFTVSK